MLRRKAKKYLKRQALSFITQFKPTINFCIFCPVTFLNACKFFIDSKHTKNNFQSVTVLSFLELPYYIFNL